MPGPYAHITLLHELMRTGRLESVFFPSAIYCASLMEYFPYCALGAVSPDYPNLARGNSNAAQWADAMHCTRACEMIESGIRRVRGAKGTVRDKQLSWLLGYCAHVVTDVTIHPVVQAKVGVYAENQRKHRICEMNQDSHIYRRMNQGEIGESDRFALTVVQCSNSDDRSQLDRDIVTLWQGMLEDVYPELYVSAPPDCLSWHREFVEMTVACDTGSVRLFPLAGVIAAKMNLAYPAFDMVDRQYVEDLALPLEMPDYLHYDEIFDRAVGNVAAEWGVVVRGACSDSPSRLPSFGNWNLDTGCDEHGRLAFW